MSSKRSQLYKKKLYKDSKQTKKKHLEPRDLNLTDQEEKCERGRSNLNEWQVCR